MDRRDLEMLRTKAREKRDRSIAVARKLYDDEVQAIEKVLGLFNGNGQKLQNARVPAKSAIKARPAKGIGAMAMVRESLPKMGNTFLRRDLLESIMKQHPDVVVNVRRVGGSLNKLVRKGKLKLIREQKGQQPGIYEKILVN